MTLLFSAVVLHAPASPQLNPHVLAAEAPSLQTGQGGTRGPVSYPIGRPSRLPVAPGVFQGTGYPGLSVPQTVSNLFPTRNGETPLELIIKKHQQEQIPADPDAAVVALKFEIMKLSSECPRNPGACVRKDWLETAAGLLDQASDLAPACGAAARAFLPFYPRADPPEAVAREFDIACLSSLERRITPAGAEPPPELPSVFVTGGRDPANQGALSAVALLEIENVPFCAALLRNDRTLVTAQHCYNYAARDIEKGRVTVRPIVGGRGPWKVAASPVVKPASDSLAVKDDWAVLKIATTDPIRAADTALVRMSKPESVTLIAHYAHHGTVGYLDASAPAWRKGLRFPRSGLCVTVEVQNNCLQLVCETVRGFSGAPIFRSTASSGSPLEVVGFVSQPTQETAQCPTNLLTTTLATSADAVRGVAIAARGIDE